MTKTALAQRRIRLFGTPRLERLTIVSATTFLALWAALLPVLVFVACITAPSLWALALVGLGLVAWTAAEYALHRFVFHLEPASPALRQLIFLLHGNHHAQPNDPLRNLMPPVVSIPVGLLLWAGAVLALGAQGTWFVLGFVVGYVAYDLVHYACHQRAMTGLLARHLKAHHLRHHHARARGNYAVTGIIWDQVLATRLAPAPVRHRG